MMRSLRGSSMAGLVSHPARLSSLRSIFTGCRAVMLPRFGGPEVLELRENVPVPNLNPNEVLVRARAVSVNPLDCRVSVLCLLDPLSLITFHLLSEHALDIIGDCWIKIGFIDAVNKSSEIDLMILLLILAC